MPRRLVPDDQLPRALALRQSGSQATSLAAGPLGGGLVALAGLSAAAWVDALTFAAVLAVLLAIRPRFDVAATVHSWSVLRGALDGVLLAARTPALRSVLLLVAGVAGFVIPSSSLLVPLLAREHGWPATLAGSVLAGQSAGTIIATLLVARFGSARRPARAAVAGLALVAAGQFTVALVGAPSLDVCATTAVGLGVGVFVANLSPVLLTTAPRTHLARVQALLSLVQSSALLVTDNLLGSVAHTTSATWAMVICAAVVTACGTGAIMSPSLRRLNKTPDGMAG